MYGGGICDGWVDRVEWSGVERLGGDGRGKEKEEWVVRFGI